jgi:prefoldin subunit 5
LHHNSQVRLITIAGQTIDGTISIINNDAIVSLNEEMLGSNVFVYGEKVEDFHNLDKNAIFTLSVSALKEIDKQVMVLQKENVNLRELTEKLTEKLENLNARVCVLERLSI